VWIRAVATKACLPKYHFLRWRTLWDLLSFGVCLLIGRRRSFARDGLRLMQVNPFPRRVWGLENVPQHGSFVAVMNHYDRDGLHPYHCAMMVNALVQPRRHGNPEIRWAFTSELWGRKVGPFPIPLPLIRWVFRRIAKVYGFVVIPRREELVMGRAAAIRTFLEAIDAGPVGLTPEAAGSGRLIEPPVGSGLFMLALARRGHPFLPIAVWEDEGVLSIVFGQPFYLEVDESLPRQERDRQAREKVMVAIGKLLPPAYRGAYAEAIAHALAAQASSPEAGKGDMG
jgi:1-acyl-sn-glycerol-3-phosphate acyltransferase